MYKVAGSNLFGQWLSKDSILVNFRVVDESIASSASLTSACWSYNIFQIKNDLYISGAFRGKENQFKKLDLPDELQNAYKLTAGNDYHLVIVDVKVNIIYVFDLNTEKLKKIKFIDSVEENIVDNVEKNTELKVIKVVTSNNSCIYLTSRGDVYCGTLPVLLNTSHLVGKVIDVALGYEHYILLTDIGSVYTWGNGRRLQLGHGDISNLDQPTEIKALAGIKITKISAGGWHSCAISEFGDLYVWGWNDTGQLGVKEQPKKDCIGLESYGLPKLVDVYDESGTEMGLNVKDVSCGSRHTAILLEDGSVWTSGCNKYGQLGFSVDITKIYSFKKSCADASILLCGPWSTVIK